MDFGDDIEEGLLKHPGLIDTGRKCSGSDPTCLLNELRVDELFCGVGIYFTTSP